MSVAALSENPNPVKVGTTWSSGARVRSMCVQHLAKANGQLARTQRRVAAHLDRLESGGGGSQQEFGCNAPDIGRGGHLNRLIERQE